MTVPPDTASALVDVIFLLGRTVRTALSHMEDELLPAALAGVLFLLWRTGECRPSELAAEMCVSQSALSRQIGELVERGYIERHPDPDDKRAHRVRVSDAGVEVLRGVRDRRAARLREALADWDETEMNDALRVLGRLNDTLAPVLTDNARRTA
ncbi:MarR family winged helix-turn-helix transcriptional regulator [Rhodococcus zopfii]|uniref:MarR family transcriptional regulator n=1 Tax=Rhodococcus zopfii TaxID=43772 RepID=A0ABU3WP34_9NOCA|nr:MarR family transcriptional regulator [Rhodococcus zopfii]MDV2475757.1 MarR family transcriptional regulator [Rhodococcus zopfii]